MIYIITEGITVNEHGYPFCMYMAEIKLFYQLHPFCLFEIFCLQRIKICSAR